VTATLLLLPFLLLFIGLPIYVILLATSLVALPISGVSMDVIQTTIFGSLDSFPLLAIPFFVLAGEIMGRGGIARRLVAWVVAIIGGVPGCLALTTIASSELFGAMSGSAVGCVAAVGRLLLPALRDEGYGDRFSVSLIASSGAIAVIIPPSIPLIIYGAVGQQPITKLFLAGLLPAILVGVLDGSYVVWRARREMIPLHDRVRWSNAVRATREAFWALLTPAVIFGGIYGGICTPTEAAGIAVVYATLVSRFIYRDVTWRQLAQIASDSGLLVGQIMIIVVAAGVYSWFLTTSGLPQLVIGAIRDWQLGSVQTLLVFNALLLVVGSFLEPPAAILILTPLFMPVITTLGIDPIHFGIIIAVNLSLGMYMPPFGLNLFASHSLFDVPLGMLYRGVLPFLAVNLVALAIITYVPAISLFLPRILH
jgi:C4-dicarboxylate transporter, DctM subunit